MQINNKYLILIFTIFYINELRNNLINNFFYNTITSFVNTYISNLFSADDITQHMGVEVAILELVETLENYSLMKVQSDQLALKKVKLSKSQIRKLCTYFDNEVKRLESLALDNLRKCIKSERSFSTFLIAYCEQSIIVGDHYDLMQELFKSRSECIPILKENLDNPINEKIDRKLMKLHYKFQSNQNYLYNCLKLITQSIEMNRNLEEINHNLKVQIEDGNNLIKNTEEVDKLSLKLESNILEIGLKESHRELYNHIRNKLEMNKGKETQDENENEDENQNQDENENQNQDENENQNQDENENQNQVNISERERLDMKTLEATILAKLEKEISEMEEHIENVFRNEEQKSKELERLERVRLRNEILGRDMLAIEKLEKRKLEKKEKQRIEKQRIEKQRIEKTKEELGKVIAKRMKGQLEKHLKKEDMTGEHLYNKEYDLRRNKVKLDPSNSWTKKVEEEIEEEIEEDEIKKEGCDTKRREQNQMQIKSDSDGESIFNRLKGTRSEFSLLWEKIVAERKRRRDKKEKEIEKEKMIKKEEMEKLKQLELMQLEAIYKTEAYQEYKEQLQREINEEDMRQKIYCNIGMENIQSERERNRKCEEKNKEEVGRKKRSVGEEWLKLMARKEASQEEKRKSLQQKQGGKGGIHRRWEEVISSERLKKERKETEKRKLERRNLEKVMESRKESNIGSLIREKKKKKKTKTLLLSKN
ncbi:hypothetical protein cand_028640 [Cryptosporidium andersoni]|uniref:Uncharacterized protein n=1 Tax=Cryptosporidium andersoni TaxID=117008 RepID=A0A1J4MQZ9_9CRYT|nr:hypothetical protein cand_028640 [Cryptosporidium andersoni]